jgi:hypothetical protein
MNFDRLRSGVTVVFVSWFPVEGSRHESFASCSSIRKEGSWFLEPQEQLKLIIDNWIL